MIYEKPSVAGMGRPSSTTATPYNTIVESRNVFFTLLADPKLCLPRAIAAQAPNVHIHGVAEEPAIPSPWRESEAVTAIKALEASVALAIGQLRFPFDGGVPSASIDTDHATISLFLSYRSTVNGFGKWDKRSQPFLKLTDIHQAQSNLYRRLSANMYQTKREGQYYHTHGSLDATPILNALGLPGFLTESQDERMRSLEEDYEGICALIQERTQRYSVEELDELTVRLRQAGAVVLRDEEFYRTEHGRRMREEPVIHVEKVEESSAPAEWVAEESDGTAVGEAKAKAKAKAKPWLLKGIKVLDLTRVIAGPSISRTLAEYGASVLKVTSPKLPDVPWYAVDLNFGKRTCELDLKDPKDRKTFEKLLDEDGGVDVVVDGYRPGSLDRLGYGVEALKERWAERGKGFVYIGESCFGHVGPWKDRSGWQPVADAISGLAWGHGVAMGLYEPVLPPFPMSDYGTGALGAAGALLALYRRAVEGGSYRVDVSLTGWNLWVQGLGQYPPDVWERMMQLHKPEIEEFKVGHLSNFDVVSKASIKSMKRLSPRLFDERYMFEMDAPGFNAPVRSMRPVVRYTSISTGFEGRPGRETRPNGYDGPKWN